MRSLWKRRCPRGGRAGGLWAIALLLLAALPLRAGELLVPDDFEKIQDAVDAAGDGDVIIVAPGAYFISEPIEINRLHDPRDASSPTLKNVTIRGLPDQRGTTSIRMRQASHPERAGLFLFDKGEGAATVVEGLTLFGGNGTRWGPNDWQLGGGAAVFVEGSSPTFRDCSFLQHQAVAENARGGAVVIWESSPTFTDCLFERNFAMGGGGAVFTSGNEAAPGFTRCVFRENATPGTGGAFFSETPASPVIERCEFRDNDAELSSGALRCGMNSRVNYATVIGNTAPDAAVVLSGQTVFENSNVARNSSRGILVLPSSTVSITNTGVESNDGRGLHVSTTSTVHLLSCVFRRNIGPTGAGASFEAATGSIAFTAFLENRATEHAGGLLLDGSSMEISNCVFQRNYGARNGGGISCIRGGETRIVDTEISSNMTSPGEFVGGEVNWGGGGLHVGSGAAPTLCRVAIVGNSARDGGGVSLAAGARGIIENSLIAANFAADSGGGVLAFSSTEAVLRHCTIAFNTSIQDGGLSCSFADPTIENSIVWGNEPESLCGRLVATLTAADPRFLRVGRHDFERTVGVVVGGVEHQLPNFQIIPGDYRLLPKSPAREIGAVLEGGPDCALDLAGNERVCGDRPDAGAYEFCGVAETLFRRGQIDADGRLTLGDAIVILNNLFRGGPAPTCAKSADINDDGFVNLADPINLLQYLFQGGPEPAPPFTDCGADPVVDALTCESSPICG